jgi:hypothetical protein
MLIWKMKYDNMKNENLNHLVQANSFIRIVCNKLIYIDRFYLQFW